MCVNRIWKDVLAQKGTMAGGRSESDETRGMIQKELPNLAG